MIHRTGARRASKGVLTFAIILATGSNAPAAEPSPRVRGDLAIQSRAILAKYCSKCHLPGADSFDILDYNVVTGKHPVAFVDPKNPGGSQIIEFIEDGSMPPAGKNRPTASETKVLKEWIAAGAPQYPKAFDDAMVLSAVRSDWMLQPKPGNVRYISFAHTITDQFKSLAPDETKLRAALAASTTSKRVPVLEQVDPAGSIYRLDIEKLGWNSPELFEAARFRPQRTAHPLIPYELILLDNPFPLSDKSFDALYGKNLCAPPVPYLRGDWLAAALAPGSPLAADLRSLVELAEAMEPTCGPKPRAFLELNAPAGTRTPITAWYGREQKDPPFEVTFTINGSANPNVSPSEPLTLEVKSGIDAQFRLLRVMSDGYTTLQIIDQGDLLFKGVARDLRTSNSANIKSIPLPANTDSLTLYFVLIVAPRDMPVPVPTIAHSLHREDCQKEKLAKVTRILFDGEEKFDPSKAVRKIVPVQVSNKK